MNLGKLCYAAFLVHHVTLEIIFRPRIGDGTHFGAAGTYICYLLLVAVLACGLKFAAEKSIALVKRLKS